MNGSFSLATDEIQEPKRTTPTQNARLNIKDNTKVVIPHNFGKTKTMKSTNTVKSPHITVCLWLGTKCPNHTR